MKKITLIALAIFTANSCADTYESEITPSAQANTEQYSTHGGPLLPIVGIIAAIKTLSEVVDGKYEKIHTYYPNGQVKSTEVRCKGFLGTCKAVARLANGGGSLTINPEEIDLPNEGELTQTIRTQIIKSDIGILYAVDKIENPDDSEKFFKSEIFNMTGRFVIDNPDVLSELELSTPIIVHGKYTVYEKEQYKFIIIHE